MPSTYSGGASSVNAPGRTATGYRIAIFNGYSEFKEPSPATTCHSCGGLRRAIQGFSSSARKLLLKRLFSLSQYPSLFITLTYPRIFPADSQEWKRHLDNFFRSLRRDFPGAWFFWKLEPQKRGAPHFHLFGELGTKVNVFKLRRYLSHLWFRVCGTNDPKHLLAGVQADFVNDSLGKMRAYVCKYVGKAETDCVYPEWARPGRFWGIHGRENLPPVLASVFDLPQKDFCQVKRLIRRWLKRLSASSRNYSSRLRSIPSFHLLAPHQLIAKLIESVLGTPVPAFVPFWEPPAVPNLNPIYN